MKDDAHASSLQLDPSEVLDLLGQLVDKSLVIVVQGTGGTEARYRMLETIRQYAQEKLVDCGEAELSRQQHLAYYLQLAELTEPELRGRTQKARLDQLEAELDNLRHALGWALQTNPEAELRLASAMLWFWHIHNRRVEGLEWLEQGLVGAQAIGGLFIQPVLLAKVLAATGCLHTGEKLAQGEAELEESLRIYRDLGPRGKAGEAFTLRWLGRCKAAKGETAQGLDLLRESLAVSREIKDTFGTGECLLLTGGILVPSERYLEAHPLLQESLALLLEIGDPDGIATAYCELGYVAFADHQLEQAKSLVEQSLSYYQQSGNREAASKLMLDLGLIAQSQGDYPTAIAYYQKDVAIQRDIGNPRSLGFALLDMGRLTLFQGNAGPARRCLEEALALCQSTGNQEGMAYTHLYLGKLAWSEGDTELAARKLGEATASGQEVGNPDLAAGILAFRSILAWAGGAEKEAEAGLKGALQAAGKINPFEWGRLGALDTLAQMKACQHPERAARLFGAMEHLCWHYHCYMAPAERAGREAALAQVKAALGEQRMAELWAEGKAMTSEQAIAYALEEDHP